MCFTNLMIVGRSLQLTEIRCEQTGLQSAPSHWLCSTMARIESVDVFILKAPLGKAKFWSSQSSFPERNSLLGAAYVQL